MKIVGKEDKHPIISSHELKLRLEQEPKKSLVQVRSKFPTIDKNCENFQDGELYVVSGPTKQGKTTLCQSFTKNFAEQQYFSLWFSYELPPRQFISCFEDDIPLFFVPDGLEARSMDWVEGKILDCLAEHNTRIVFIDHLHFLFELIQRGNISLTIGNVIRRLKNLAINHKLIIFLLCHTTKASYGDDNVTYSSIRDSSFVAQEADCVIMIKRTSANEGQVKIEFHRRTGCFDVVLPIIKHGKHFYEAGENYGVE